MTDFQIAASILSADFARLGEEVEQVLEAGVDRIHFDVMDHHYVPNLTVGPVVCQSLRAFGIKAPIDVHLMVEPVDELIMGFVKAGATAICFHPEASKHIDRSLQLILDHGCQAGLAFNPATALSTIRYVADKLDYIILMSVNPGFGGQSFLPSAWAKLQEARALLEQLQLDQVRLELDGGVKVGNIRQVASLGANGAVLGSAIFGSDHYAATLTAIRQALSSIA